MTHDRYRGALLGLAAGDALGTTLEFKPSGTFAPLADMIGGREFHLKPGEWTGAGMKFEILLGITKLLVQFASNSRRSRVAFLSCPNRVARPLSRQPGD
jgi:ADP-ribosylglycohydrolase